MPSEADGHDMWVMSQSPVPLARMHTMTERQGEAEQDTDDLDSPYVLIQRQFEDSDDNWCYIETHDGKYCGHFLLRRVDFTPQKLSITLDRPRDNLVSVTFAMAATEFAKASQVVKILVARSSLPDARAA
jgi:hypothetical protein